MSHCYLNKRGGGGASTGVGTIFASFPTNATSVICTDGAHIYRVPTTWLKRGGYSFNVTDYGEYTVIASAYEHESRRTVTVSQTIPVVFVTLLFQDYIFKSGTGFTGENTAAYFAYIDHEFGDPRLTFNANTERIYSAPGGYHYDTQYIATYAGMRFTNPGSVKINFADYNRIAINGTNLNGCTLYIWDKDEPYGQGGPGIAWWTPPPDAYATKVLTTSAQTQYMDIYDVTQSGYIALWNAHKTITVTDLWLE